MYVGGELRELFFVLDFELGKRALIHGDSPLLHGGEHADEGLFHLVENLLKLLRFNLFPCALGISEKLRRADIVTFGAEHRFD